MLVHMKADAALTMAHFFLSSAGMKEGPVTRYLYTHHTSSRALIIVSRAQRRHQFPSLPFICARRTQNREYREEIDSTATTRDGPEYGHVKPLMVRETINKVKIFQINNNQINNNRL